MEIVLKNELNNNTKTIGIDTEKIAKDFLEEYKADYSQVIQDISFDGFYNEVLFSYVEGIIDEMIDDDYSYDYEDCLKIIEEVTNHIIH